MRLIPTTTFLLRITKGGERIVAERGVAIEVTKEEYDRFRHKFISTKEAENSIEKKPVKNIQEDNYEMQKLVKVYEGIQKIRDNERLF